MEPSIWSDPVVTDLRALAELQFSAAKIAAQLAHKHGITVTRSAVIGKAFRDEIKLNGPNGQHLRPRMSREEANRRRRDHHMAQRIKRQGMKSEQREEIETAPPIEDIAISIGQRKTFLQLRDCDCKWPVGEPGSKDFFFCGGARIGELPYCAYHARVAYKTPVAHTRKPSRGYSRTATGWEREF